MLCLFALVMAGQQSAVAQTKNKTTIAPDFRINHYETLNNLIFENQPLPERKPTETQALKVIWLSFDSFGQHFELKLENNDELLKHLPKTQRQRLRQSMQIFKGSIPGIQGSWARINRNGESISGAVWDGSELYLIDSSDEVIKAIGQSLNARKSTKPYTIIYRLSETESQSTCAVEPNAKPFNYYRNLVQELKSLAAPLPQATRKLDVSIVADAQFTQANSANPQAAVVARMNIVDGIYSEQVGVHLNISEIRTLSNNGILSSTDSNTLLDQLAAYTSAPGFNNPGLSHLFTGRNLDGNTAGIAYIGVLCRKDIGIGLSQTHGTGIEGALTVAHEMGHNFGAPHDSQSGSACTSTGSNFIMNPYLNGSDQFSQCSIQQMASHISNAACLTAYTDAPSADVRPIIPVSPVNAVVSASFTYRVEVKNTGTAESRNTKARITIPSPLAFISVSASSGQCAYTAGIVNCTIGLLAPNTSSTFTMRLGTGTAPANILSNVMVSADNDSNATNNSTNVAINVINSTGTTLFESHFNSDFGGFVYSDNTFRSTSQPAYASGRRVVSDGNGHLRVVLGGRDNADVDGMSGGWRRNFNLSKKSAVTVSFNYRIDQSPHYESNEYSDALFALDGRLIGVNAGNFLTRIAGDGTDGPVKSSGMRHIDMDLGILPAGNHSITVGGFNSRKTYFNESTQILIDNIKAVVLP